MNDYDIEYDINGDNFEYAQELCRHSENFYGLDNSTAAHEARAYEAYWDEINSEEYHLYDDEDA